MIDTIKIYSMINKETYNCIKSNSIIKKSYNNKTGEIIYTIVNDHIKGSYNSSLSVRVGNGAKYNFANMYYIEIEGSYHKIKKGYNSHNGFYNMQEIIINLINIVENTYYIILPNLKHWFLQRIDIAICYDLKNQENVKRYIDNLNKCNYPRRKLKHFDEETVYSAGSTTTIKVYNKLQEFRKNDLKKVKDTSFDYYKYIEKIQGYVRFECEIKKRKLQSIYGKKYIRCNQVFYSKLKKIWKEEFEIFLKAIDSELTTVREKDEVKERLNQLFSSKTAKNLYNFYLLILYSGISEVKKNMDKSSYYKKISQLKKANIDFSQTYNLNSDNEIINFNPFNAQEIL